MKIEDTKAFRHIPQMSDYVIESFQHVDDFRCFRPIAEYAEDLAGPFEKPDRELSGALLAVLKERLAAAFKTKGWEGDGEMNVVFVPPFLCSTGATSCSAIFHVKQSNNGTSFVALPKGVKFGFQKQW